MVGFGVGVGDILVLSQLCWKVYKKCKDSGSNFAELSTQVSSLYTVIKETEELAAQQSLEKEQQARLSTCCQGCEVVVKDLDKLLTKYESLGT